MLLIELSKQDISIIRALALMVKLKKLYTRAKSGDKLCFTM